MKNQDFLDYPVKEISLTTGTFPDLRVPQSSGLNWGQRPGREQNQAYLAIPSEIQKSNFFPPPSIEFLVVTDDGIQWKCARRQANGKAIHTIDNNSIIGLYFRKRLGLEPGDLVTYAHLLRYGRNDVSFYKKSDYHYFMDFSV